MEDGAGKNICRHDLVMLIRNKKNKSTTAHHHHRHGDCAMALRSFPGHKVVEQGVDGTEATEYARDVAVVDRSFLHPGKVVALASDRGGQVGVVTGTTTVLDLLSDSGADVASGVSPTEVRRVRELCLGDYVIAAGQRWLGRVFELALDVDVLFDGGAAVCRVSRASSKLTIVDKDCLNRNTNCCFSPGKRVVDGVGGSFKASRWLKGYWKRSYSQGTVSKVQIATVRVHWIASPSSDHVQQPPPPADQLPDNVTFFCPGNEMNFWTAGDRCFFRTPCCSSNNSGNNNAVALFERPMTVAATCTVVDVVWQDGSRQRCVPSASLFPAVTQHGLDFFPGQRVVLRANNDDDGHRAARVGLVRSFSCKDQTVRVAWAPRTRSDVEEPAAEMECTAYDLLRNNSNDSFYGDIVVRRQSMMDGNDLSWVGQIVDLSCDDGEHDLRVKWGDGTTTNVSLPEIAVVKRSGVFEMLQRIRGSVHNQAPEGIVQATARMIERVGAWVEAVFCRTGEMIAQGRRYLVMAIIVEAPASSDEDAGTEEEETSCAATEDGCSNDDDGSDIGEETSSKVDAATEGGREKQSSHFPQFDVVQSPSDHHFLDSKEQQGTGDGRKWTKRVHREWKILQNDLPAGTIYARAFEDRMDLLRVAMVGACGTPYHDGLFFFDLQLPPSYPDSPPQVCYRSYGLRLNPNLYESGTVCLSLLNTFGGRGTELWSPESSTVLQVLVSIQGLVLTAQPYYNEAGYASQVGTAMGHRNDLPYSEKAYLLTLQTMMHLMRRPPAGFEDLVGDHFRYRGCHVLRACKAYMEDGCLVGSLDAEANATEASSARLCSVGFRLALANIVPRLREELINIGAQEWE